MCGGLFLISASAFTSLRIHPLYQYFLHAPVRGDGKVSIVKAPMMVTRTGKRLWGSGKEGLDRAWGERSKSGAD